MANPGDFPLDELVDLLEGNWRTALVRSNGNLNKAALDRNIAARKKIPSAFLEAFKTKHPTFVFPDWTPGTSQSANDPVLDDMEDDASSIRKRKFSWFTNEWAGDRDDLNDREADGTLKALRTYTGGFKEGEHVITLDGAVPESLKTDEFIEYWNAIYELYEVNGQVYYDSETLALGSLVKSEYLLVPSNWKFDECPIEEVGSGLDTYKVPIPTMAAIYALAKDQAKELKLSDDEQIRWAVLRLEAVKSGWFARQKYTMYRKAPDNCFQTMLADSKRIFELVKQAYSLCAFIPFMAEYHFRAFGAAYTRANSADYVARAKNFAASASLTDCLAYMENDLLYGKALVWIGVKRPMEVLRNSVAVLRIPSPFQIRAYASPAGQAIISTTIAVIDSIRAAGWWEIIKSTGGYDDTALIAVGEKIAANPWRFHMMHHVYNEAVLSEDDKRQVIEARRLAVMYAPFLQAYAVTVMKDTPLGRIRALKKHADANKTLFMAAKSLFLKVMKTRAVNVEQVFAAMHSRFKIHGGSSAP